MLEHDETIWWMTSEWRMVIGSDAPAGDAGSMASGTVRPDSGCGVISVYRGEPATLGSLPRGLLDELTAYFPGVRWWVRDVPECVPMRSVRSVNT